MNEDSDDEDNAPDLELGSRELEKVMEFIRNSTAIGRLRERLENYVFRIATQQKADSFAYDAKRFKDPQIIDLQRNPSPSSKVVPETGSIVFKTDAKAQKHTTPACFSIFSRSNLIIIYLY